MMRMERRIAKVNGTIHLSKFLCVFLNELFNPTMILGVSFTEIACKQRGKGDTQSNPKYF